MDYVPTPTLISEPGEGIKHFCKRLLQFRIEQNKPVDGIYNGQRINAIDPQWNCRDLHAQWVIAYPLWVAAERTKAEAARVELYELRSKAESYDKIMEALGNGTN